MVIQQDTRKRNVKYKDLTGMKFGRLTVLERTDDRLDNSGNRYITWKCKCDCGKTAFATGNALKNGGKSSCGCLNEEYLERRKEGRIKNTRLYTVYQKMKRRCNKPTERMYKFYGGRGIKVCDEWNTKHGYRVFEKWALENGYKEGLELDRINCNGDYEPSNCRLVTHREQMRNTRRNKLYEYNGKKMILTDLAEELGVDSRILSYEFKKGYSIDEVKERQKKRAEK